MRVAIALVLMFASFGSAQAQSLGHGRGEVFASLGSSYLKTEALAIRPVSAAGFACR
jgi:hypothetical protein